MGLWQSKHTKEEWKKINKSMNNHIKVASYLDKLSFKYIDNKPTTQIRVDISDGFIGINLSPSDNFCSLYKTFKKDGIPYVTISHCKSFNEFQNEFKKMTKKI